MVLSVLRIHFLPAVAVWLGGILQDCQDPGVCGLTGLLLRFNVSGNGQCGW
jgi:hypothetical protein